MEQPAMTAGAWFYELTAHDVGRATISAFGRSWLVTDFMGRVLPRDVGKRVYLRVDILQVENDQQRDSRIGITQA
jgi:uncharacterized protein affecting Mg2+/Co2+ transport